jgi:hypothetical protein
MKYGNYIIWMIENGVVDRISVSSSVESVMSTLNVCEWQSPLSAKILILHPDYTILFSYCKKGTTIHATYQVTLCGVVQYTINLFVV